MIHERYVQVNKPSMWRFTCMLKNLGIVNYNLPTALSFNEQLNKYWMKSWIKVL